MSHEILLEVSGLSISFGGLRAVDGFSMAIRKGEIVSLIGPNGAGKTTVLNLLSGFAKATGGRIVYRERETTRLSAANVAAIGIRRTFQQNSLMFDLSVQDNIRAGLHTRTSTGLLSSLFHTSSFRRENAAVQTAVEHVLVDLGMRDQRHALARNLPFGDQRKLGIGIALAGRPDLLLLDEPAAGLNPDESEQLTRLIRRLRDAGITIVLVEHDMRVVMSVSDRIVVLSRGQKLAEGTGKEISTNEEVLRAYLGDGAWATPATSNAS